jgi:hypothetical protein
LSAKNLSRSNKLGHTSVRPHNTLSWLIEMKLKDSREIIGKDYPTGLMLLCRSTMTTKEKGSQLLIQHRLNEKKKSLLLRMRTKPFILIVKKTFITNVKKTFITTVK